MPKAIQIHAHGGPEVLRWEEIDVPAPAAHEVRIRQEAVGLNYVDIYYRIGLYKAEKLPAILGMEAAGVIDAVGNGVTGFKIGDRVAYAGGPTGAYAESRIMPAARVVALPAWCSSRQAASMLLQGMTAHYLIHDAFRLESNHTVLLHAAAGGVGQILTQWAKAKGATVIATVGSEPKAAKVRQLGADHVINYVSEDFVARVKEVTAAKGVDVVYDSVGQATFMGSLDCLRPRGLLASFGQASGAVPAFDPGILSAKGSLFLTRPSLGHYIGTPEELSRRASDLFKAVQEGVLKIESNQSFALKDAAEAHRALEARQTTGSVVLLV
ncbi:MAG: quinone oxidoreductase [Pseudomonadota bacterium]|nr:quinone oxidoreductase [Pseudomonadota bacterium]